MFILQHAHGALSLVEGGSIHVRLTLPHADVETTLRQEGAELLFKFLTRAPRPETYEEDHRIGTLSIAQGNLLYKHDLVDNSTQFTVTVNGVECGLAPYAVPSLRAALSILKGNLCTTCG